jgi:hypothetical protein
LRSVNECSSETVRYLLATLILSAGATVASADNCDILMDRLTTAVPGLQLDGRVHTTAGFDAFNMHNVNAHQVVVYCGPKLLKLNVDFQNGFPPPAYFELVGQMVTASMKVSDEPAANIARQCARRARISNDDEAKIEAAGIKVVCGWIGGATQITVVKSGGPLNDQEQKPDGSRIQKATRPR